jgi:hypothetical protein
MSGRLSIEDERERQQFVGDPAVMDELELRLADLADEDLRAVVIRHEHPSWRRPSERVCGRSTARTAR